MGAFRDPLGLPWGPLGLLWEVSRGPLGSLWGSFGGPWGCFLGSVEPLLAAEACLGGPLGVPGGSWGVLKRLGGDFRDFRTNSGRPFGFIL